MWTLSLVHLALLITSIFPCHAYLAYRGADISSLPKQEKWGKTFRGYLEKKSRPLENILAGDGFNTIRLRLLVNPPYDYGLRDTLALAKRVKRAGMKLHLCLHLSDEFADPLHQITPKTWQSPPTIGNVLRHLEAYTKFVGDFFAENGVSPDFIAIGNEARAGILWPYGQYPRHESMSRLFKAGVRGVRASKSAHTKIVIHVDSQGRWDWTSEFFNKILAYPHSPDHMQLADFDVIGHTFYPYYADWITFANQNTVIQNCKRLYHKEQHIVETSWPVKCAHKDLKNWPKDQRGIPFSPEGQIQYLTKVSQFPDITGMIIWEPAWLTFPGQGNTCEDVLLFEPNGNARHSLKIFKAYAHKTSDPSDETHPIMLDFDPSMEVQNSTTFETATNEGLYH